MFLGCRNRKYPHVVTAFPYGCSKSVLNKFRMRVLRIIWQRSKGIKQATVAASSLECYKLEYPNAALLILMEAAMRAVVLCMSLLLMVHETATAKKPDWPGGGGTAVIGFGLVELTPQKSGEAFVPTTFIFNYDIPKAYTKDLGAGQMVVVPALAAEQYNDIPSSTFLAYLTAQKLLSDA